MQDVSYEVPPERVLAVARRTDCSAYDSQYVGLEPGDEVELIPRMEGGERVWILQKRKAPQRPWFGRLKAYASKPGDHSIESVRESIRKGRTKNK